MPVSLAIPATLHDSLMARLDRLDAAKEVAQLGATLGREFSHELLQAISPVDKETLQRGPSQLVDAELIHQRGLPPHKQYIFKHSLFRTRPINRYSRAAGSSCIRKWHKC